MSIENITAKIISDGEESAASALKEAKTKADAIIKEAEARAEEILNKAISKGQEEKEKLITRRRSVAEIDGRKLILENKQKLIAQCFEEALNELINMDRKKYITLLSSMIKDTGITKGEVILNEKDRSVIGQDLLSEVKNQMAGSDLILSEEVGKMKGGFLIKKGQIYMNGTIESLIDEARDSLVAEVAEQLFQ